MKKLKSFIPLLLAVCFTATLLGCKDEPSSPQSLDADASLESEFSDESSSESTEIDSSSSSLESGLVPPAETPAVELAQYVRCTGENVNIRAGAGTNFAVLGSAEKGTTYAVTGKTGNWYKTYYRGKTAYISTSYAAIFTLEKTESKTEKVIEEGYKHVGVPYVYGAVRFHDGNGNLLAGFTAQKFDCSSLIQYVFYQGSNTLLGLHTRAQVKQGKYVARENLRRGDCIYFTNESRQYNTGIERIGHVALYLGEGYILHTSSDYARIEKMNAKRWSFYVEARRFI